MKKRVQGFIAGTLSGIIIAGGIAIAANTTTLNDVITNGIKIVVDGQKLNPKDANGKTVEPFIYNGTTYLPVRAVADALGKEVYWDGPNFTVYLGNMGGRLEYPTVELEDMVSIGDTIEKAKNLTDNYGNTYSRAINNDYGHHELEYLLNMKYSRFRGILYVPSGTTSDYSMFVKIIADGKTIYTSPQITKSSSPIDVDVNVTGYNNLKIEFSETSNNKFACYLAEAGFYQ